MLTKEKDEEYKFKHMISTTIKNIKSIYVKFDLKNIREVDGLILNGYINVKCVEHLMEDYNCDH